MSLEKKKKEVELLRVTTARAELEFKILEREEDIKRIKEHINIQLEREKELKEQIKNLN